MRIAQVAPLVLPVPPVRYGGTERVIFALTEELVRRGHDVTLFAAGTSRTSARLVPCSPRPLWELDPSISRPYQQGQLDSVCKQLGEFDIVHTHTDHFLCLAKEMMPTPLVATLHGSLDLPETWPILKAEPDHALVSISNSQRRPASGLRLNWAATVHHGLDLAHSYGLGRGTGGYLLFLGRISPQKDPVTAINVAIRCGLRLKIAARVDPADEGFFQDEVRPLLGHPLVEWLGEQTDRQKAALLGGSVPEFLRNGEHGFLVESEDEMVDACRNLEAIDRRACREWALQHFSAERMTSEYLRVYRQIIDGAREPAA